MRHPVYLAYAALLLGLATLGGYRGSTLTRVNELRNVPKSIRDNPGAYRALYSGYPRYFGGK